MKKNMRIVHFSILPLTEYFIQKIAVKVKT